MDNYLKRLSSDITNDKISLQGKTYLKSELSNLIINHNKNLVIPASGDLLEEKEEVYA
jgi:ATP-dependent protease HslVU (ClpYQ) peptidase subunit